LPVLAAKLTSVPLNLANDATMTGATSVKISWDAPTDNGGSPVIDYRISMKLTTDSTWTVLASDITLTEYTATSLTSDLIYDFKVESRNLVGYSPETTIISIRAAAVPAQPNQPLTDIIGLNVVITWDKPLVNGSPITAYQIIIKQNNLQFTEDMVNCDGT
jgi:hypothetical protein